MKYIYNNNICKLNNRKRTLYRQMQRQKSYSLQPLRRKWSKVIQPIVNYKRDDYGLSNPLDFYYQLEEMIDTGLKIHVNIPQTLTGTRDNFLQTVFQSQDQQIGTIKLKSSYSKSKFQFQAQKSIKQSLHKIRSKSLVEDFFNDQDESMNNRNFWLPFVVLKQAQANNNQRNLGNLTGNKIVDPKIKIKLKERQNYTMVWNSYQYKKISSIDTNQISQVYIFTKNLSASITRYFYHSSSNKSIAYKIENEDSLIEQKKSKAVWKVEEKREGSCRFIKMMHENKSFHTQTVNLIKTIEKYLGKEIVKIVTDWIIDPFDRYYLIDVKQIQLTEPKPKFRITKSLSELLSTVTCSMCLQTCNQAEISKVLTNKLITNFYEHLTKRGISLSFRINFKKITNLSRVCDLCYSLVVAQTKLIESEEKMKTICHFGNDGSRYQTKFYNKIGFKHSQNLGIPLSMHQWRLFFYLEDIKDFYNIFNSNKLKFDQTQFQIGLSIHDSTTYFELKSPFSNSQNIKSIKIEHILSNRAQIGKYLQKSQVRVQILPKSSNGKPIAEGCMHGIFSQDNTFCTDSYQTLQRKYKQILLFNEESEYGILGFYVGICYDGVKTIYSNYTNGNNDSRFGCALGDCQYIKEFQIYRINGKVNNCGSLPAEWMEIVYPNYCQNIANREKIEQYSQLSGQVSKMTKNQVNTSSFLRISEKQNVLRQPQKQKQHARTAHSKSDYSDSNSNSKKQTSVYKNNTIYERSKCSNILKSSQQRQKLVL